MNNNDVSSCKTLSLSGLMLFLLFSFVTGCAGNREQALSGNALEFAIIGDAPYNAKQKNEFNKLTKEINATELAFVIHVGDFAFDGIGWTKATKGLPPCADNTYEDRLALAQNFKHPFIFTPGDNDWTDCHRAKPHAFDPVERLSQLRQIFFQDEKSLGQGTLDLVRQSRDKEYSRFRENVRWTAANVLFVTLHMVGSNNNLGRSSKMDEEFEERNTANLVWLQDAFELAKRNGNKAIMIIAHANPNFETSWTARQQRRYLLGGLKLKSPQQRRTTGFDEFLETLEEETIAFAKPVVYVHGDTHTFRIDKPLVGSMSRRFIENFTRVETYGFPDTHWLKVTIDPDDPNVFRFRQEFVKENLVNH